MKRILAAVCALVMIFAVNAVWGATVQEETMLEGVDMAVDTPEDWYVLTRSREVLDGSAAYFDMTTQEALQFMQQNDFYLVLYQPETGAEMYVTVFLSEYARQLGPLDELTGEEMEQVKQEIATGYEGWAMDSEVTELDEGELTWLAVTMHYGEEGSRTDNRQIFSVWEGQEIYIDLYAGPEGLNERLVQAQDELAASLRCGVAARQLEEQRQQHKAYVGVMVGLMAMLLVQCVGLSLSIFLATRREE